MMLGMQLQEASETGNLGHANALMSRTVACSSRAVDGLWCLMQYQVSGNPCPLRAEHASFGCLTTMDHTHTHHNLR